MFDGSNCDRKSQLSGILTEPLNPRVLQSLEIQWQIIVDIIYYPIYKHFIKIVEDIIVSDLETFYKNCCRSSGFINIL